MLVFACICVYLRVPARICVFARICVYLRVPARICMYLRACAYLCVYLRVFVGLCVHMYVFVFICTFLHVFAYICKYLHVIARFYSAMSRHDVAVFVIISSLLRHLERSLKEAINTWGRGFTTWELLEQGVNCQHGHTKLCIPTYQHTEGGVDYHTKTYCSAATSE